MKPGEVSILLKIFSSYNNALFLASLPYFTKCFSSLRRKLPIFNNPNQWVITVLIANIFMVLLYSLFWSDKGITGLARFVERFWTMLDAKETKVVDEKVMKISVHKLIKKISEDIEKFHFNTAVASLMEFTNIGLKNGLDKTSKKIAAQLIAPLAPHLAEECWSKLGGKYSIFDSTWPKYDAKFTVDDTVRIGVQVNGKVRGEIEIGKDTTQEEAIKLARANENVLKYLSQGKVVKEIYVPGRIIGFVVK